MLRVLGLQVSGWLGWDRRSVSREGGADVSIYHCQLGTLFVTYGVVEENKR